MEEEQKLILQDTFNRVHSYLRISLTDRCNLRCNYCMPENIVFMPKNHLLSADEIEELAIVFVGLGINKIRITGGEPLVRKDFPDILERLSKLPVDLAITTNAYLLDAYIVHLKKANISSVNISLDTLSKDKFQDSTHRNYFQKTIENIELAIDSGLNVKLNAVITRGFNEDEIIKFVELSEKFPIEVRFIEFMPFRDNNWKSAKTFSRAEILSLIEKKYQYTQTDPEANQTATKYQVNNFKGTFGIISTVTEPFCETCNRLRLTADGKLKNCLFGTTEYNLKEALQNKLDLESLIRKAVTEKHEAHGGITKFSDLSVSKYQQNRSMVSIGG